MANTIERAVILEDDDLVDTKNLSLPVERVFRSISESTKRREKGSLVSQEKELILKALQDCFWVQKDAAGQLGISPRSLNYKVKKFGITHPNWLKHK